MSVIDIVGFFILFLLFVPTIVVSSQLLIALVSSAEDSESENPSCQDVIDRPSITVLMPAHNEALIIEDTLTQLTSVMHPEDRVVVIADNCSDQTAFNARKFHDVEVIERSCEDNRGKGYALDYGFRSVSNDPTDVVIVLDADCVISSSQTSDPLGCLAAMCIGSGQPIQALYLMKSPQTAGVSTKLAEFAWKVKNLVRPLGYRRLGLPCQLMGAGMVFSWRHFGGVDLANGNIVEDLAMGIDLSKQGAFPALRTSVTVDSYFPSSADASSSQKTRWEHGHLQTILTIFPRLFATSLRNRDLRLLSMALDLSVPPLALLVISNVLALCVCCSFYVLDMLSPALFGFQLISVSVFSLAVFLTWIRWGQDLLSLTDLLIIPWYVIKKIPFYLQAFVKRETKWIKTKRDE